MSKKMGIIFICLIAISGVIEFSFKQSAIAHIIARVILLIFGLLTAAVSNPTKEFEVVKHAVLPGSYPWNQENVPIEIKTKRVVIPFWTLYIGSAGHLPYSEQEQLKTDPPVEITLIPYGCTTLRITEFPVVQYKK
jgi:hypothetical protein